MALRANPGGNRQWVSQGSLELPMNRYQSSRLGLARLRSTTSVLDPSLPAGLSGCQAGCPPRSEDYTQFQRLEKREAEGEGSLCCLDEGSPQVMRLLPLPLLRQADTGSLGPLSPGGRHPLQPVLQLLAPFLWSEIGQIGIQAPNSSSFLAEGLRASPFSSQPISSSIQGK